MRLFAAALLLILIPAGAGAAVVSPISAISPGLLCRAAISGAEQGQAIPTHLMAAIGRVESGRRDPDTGAWHPWPWTVNAEGQGYFFASKAQAIAAVQAMQARGVRSIDVGCMQINLQHHPDAFSGLDQAFDPAANTAYAARFLRQLYGQTGTWPKAVALYHSATPELAEPYARKVMAMWPEEARHPAPAAALAAAWSATLSHRSFMPFQRRVGPAPPVETAVSSAGPAVAPGLAPGLAPSLAPGLAHGLAYYRAVPIMSNAHPLPGFAHR